MSTLSSLNAALKPTFYCRNETHTPAHSNDCAPCVGIRVSADRTEISTMIRLPKGNTAYHASHQRAMVFLEEAFNAYIKQGYCTAHPLDSLRILDMLSTQGTLPYTALANALTQGFLNSSQLRADSGAVNNVQWEESLRGEDRSIVSTVKESVRMMYSGLFDTLLEACNTARQADEATLEQTYCTLNRSPDPKGRSLAQALTAYIKARSDAEAWGVQAARDSFLALSGQHGNHPDPSATAYTIALLQSNVERKMVDVRSAFVKAFPLNDSPVTFEDVVSFLQQQAVPRSASGLSTILPRPTTISEEPALLYPLEQTTQADRALFMHRPGR